MEKKCVWLLAMVFCVGLLLSAASADITTGLVAYWPFDTNLNDLSGVGSPSNGTAKGDASLVSDPVRGDVLAIRSNATSMAEPYGFVDCGNGSKLNVTTAMTLGFWYKDAVFDENLDNSWRRIVTKGENSWRTGSAGYGDASHGEADDNEIQFWLTDGDDVIQPWTDGDPITDGEWAHIACVFDGSESTVYIYVNGELEVEESGGVSSISANTAHLLIGEIWEALDPGTGLPSPSQEGYGRPARGRFDNLFLFDRALSQSDVQELMAYATQNVAPSVDAGAYYSGLVSTAIALDKASAADDGEPDPPATVTYLWEKVSGPGTVNFVNATDLNPTATFSAAGEYVIKLTADDSEKSNSSEAIVVVRPSDDPIARWNFENDLTDSVNSFDGSLAGAGYDPNFVAGHIGSKALELYCADASGGKYIEIAEDEAVDPNLWDLKYEMTVACWVKDTSNTQWETILAKGSDSWRFHYDNWDPYIGFCGSGTSTDWWGVDDADMNVVDGYWHHVAGVYDGAKMYAYVDGVEDSSVETTGLISQHEFPPTIGVEVDISSGSPVAPFSGQIDDLRVYSYALTPSQVESLADMANRVPFVDAGADQEIVLQVGSTTLAGSVVDDGKPVAATLLWEKVSGPGNVVFVDDSDATTSVSFDAAGIYLLSLTADDTTASLSDEVTIKVVAKDCADVINEGLALLGDISGPSDVPDCYVDLYDFTVMASNWMQCNDPQDSACTLPY